MGDDGLGGVLFGVVLMDVLGGKISCGIVVVLMLGLLVLGLKWLLGFMFGWGVLVGCDEYFELDLGLLCCGSVESEWLCMSSLYGSVGFVCSSFFVSIECCVLMLCVFVFGFVLVKCMLLVLFFVLCFWLVCLMLALVLECLVEYVLCDDWKVLLLVFIGGSCNS